MNQDVFRVMELAHEGYYCSQIIIIMGLEARDESNTGLVRAMRGLALGGGSPGGVCGALTGAACLISLYCGKGAGEETEDAELAGALSELWNWFEGTFGVCDGSVCCGPLLESGPGQKQRCGRMVLEAYNKAVELMKAHGLAVA